MNDNTWDIVEDDSFSSPTDSNAQVIEHNNPPGDTETAVVFSDDPSISFVNSGLLASSEELTLQEAETLTQHIRSASVVLYALIARAHSGKAWKVLGYTSFEKYVHEEFAISRSRAYQLLNQSRFVEEIQANLPEGTPPVVINEATARDLKDLVGEIAPEIRERTKDLDPQEAGAVVEEILEDMRERKREEEENSHAYDDAEYDNYDGEYSGDYNGNPHPREEEIDLEDAFDDDLDGNNLSHRIEMLYNLWISLGNIKSLLPPAEMIEIIPEERYTQVDETIYKAQAWINDFSQQWSELRASQGADSETENTEPETQETWGHDNESADVFKQTHQ